MSNIDSGTCGICRTIVPLENVFQIFDRTCKKLVEEIAEISEINFCGIFEQPWYICMKCYTDLLTAQEFRRKCIESHKKQIESKKTDGFLNLNELLGKITESPVEELVTNTSLKKCSVDETEKGMTKKQVIKVCEICGNVFHAKRNFAVHLRRHSNNKPFDCELCLNKFYTNAELKCHMRKHTGEKPYECNYCKRKFSDYGTHKKHERTHTNDRPFSCNFCEKAFTSTFILKNHILTHTGKRAFECKVCCKSFLYHGHLTSHLKSMFHLRNCKRAELEEETNI